MAIVTLQPPLIVDADAVLSDSIAWQEIAHRERGVARW
jgi:hypothetical protein